MTCCLSIRTAAVKNHLPCFESIIKTRVEEKGLDGLYCSFKNDDGTYSTLYSSCLEHNHPFLLIACRDYKYAINPSVQGSLCRFISDVCPDLVEYYLGPDILKSTEPKDLNLNLLLCEAVDVLASMHPRRSLVEERWQRGVRIVSILRKAGACPSTPKYPSTRAFYYDQRSALDHARVVINPQRRQDILGLLEDECLDAHFESIFNESRKED